MLNLDSIRNFAKVRSNKAQKFINIRQRISNYSKIHLQNNLRLIIFCVQFPTFNFLEF